MAKDKKMKTAFVRVSAINDTQNGRVEYTFEDFKNTVISWSQSCRFLYYMIEHNGEPEDENKHFHVVLSFGSTPTQFSTIKNKFPYGRIEPARSIRATVQYLVHYNDLSKRTYEWTDIVTNDPNIDRYKVLSAQALDLKVKKYIDQIMLGEIREYNFATAIEPEVFAKRKTQLYNALEQFRMKTALDKTRHIEVIICQGPGGCGKTTYVKEICKAQGKSLAVSSGSNDPWQDYHGEDVMLLDELRSDVFSLSDLLKILDNHTKSTSRSRYSNKLFLGDTIFITTNEEWQDWYKDADEVERNALKRRVSKFLKFAKKTGQPYTALVETYVWNPDAVKYEYVSTRDFEYGKYFPNKERVGMDLDMLFS